MGVPSDWGNGPYGSPPPAEPRRDESRSEKSAVLMPTAMYTFALDRTAEAYYYALHAAAGSTPPTWEKLPNSDRRWALERIHMLRLGGLLENAPAVAPSDAEGFAAFSAFVVYRGLRFLWFVEKCSACGSDKMLDSQAQASGLCVECRVSKIP